VSERKRILLVEDEYMIAEDMAEDLRTLGVEVVGPVPSVERALAAVQAEADLDGAVLDINLKGQMVYPVVDALRERNVPVLFTTGYDAGAIPARYANVERCEKPLTGTRLKAALTTTLKLDS
jgi:CheY-like chemotaxis protein